MRSRKDRSRNGISDKLQLRGALGRLDFENILAGFQALHTRHQSPRRLAGKESLGDVLAVQRGAEFFRHRVGFDQSIAAGHHAGAAGEHADFDAAGRRRGA
jgi:hypothetical protein